MRPLGGAGEGSGAGGSGAEGGDRGVGEKGGDDYIAVFDKRGAEKGHSGKKK